jgi:hypothetical protein
MANMMRFGSTTVMFALLLGAAPALAQESPGILPVPQSTEKATAARASSETRAATEGCASYRSARNRCRKTRYAGC